MLNIKGSIVNKNRGRCLSWKVVIRILKKLFITLSNKKINLHIVNYQYGGIILHLNGI